METVAATQAKGKPDLIGADVHAARARALPQTVLVTLALLLSLISFFVDIIRESGVTVHYETKFVEGILILTLSINGKPFEWTSSTFTTSPTNRRRLYDITTQLLNGIYLSGNRFTPIFRYLQLLGVYLPSKSTFIRRIERELKPAVVLYYSHQQAAVLSRLRALRKDLKIQADEQFSRSQRNGGLGHAPMGTAIGAENVTGLIFERAHVDRLGVPEAERNKLGHAAQRALFQLITEKVHILLSFYPLILT